MTQRPTTPHVAAQPADKPTDSTDVPTLRLPRLFTPTGYSATLTIDPARDTFEGVIAITGQLKERTPVIWLHGRDLEIKRAAARQNGDVALTVTRRGEDLLEVRGAFAAGDAVINIEYTGKLDILNSAGAFKQTYRGAAYVYTQFEALYARRVFPCLDEPDSKVPWQLTIEVPKSVIAVSNTPVVRESDADGRRRYEFARTKPLPSYLVAFGVGPFDIVDAGTSKRGTPVRIITMKGRSAEAAYAAKHTGRLLDLLEDYFGSSYPYEKLDILVVPIVVGFGAMENVGLVTMIERLVLFDKPTWDQRRAFIAVTAHEIAHHWFGNYVTMAWWDDLWLNEGFATWLGRKITGRFEPDWGAELAELDTRMTALDADALVHARRVRQPIAKVGDIENAFDGITYSKGAAVLSTFEAYVGADVFQRGVRGYLQSRAFGNATSADFVAALSAAAGKDLAPAFATYLDQPGAPELEATLVCEGRASRVELSQRRFVPSGSPEPSVKSVWHVPVCLAYDRNGKRAEICTLLTNETDTLPLDAKRCPRWLMPSAHGRGYYRVRYTADAVTRLRDEGWSQLTWTERRALFFDVVAATRYNPRGVRTAIAGTPSGKLPLTLVASLVPKLLAGGDRFTMGDALSVMLSLHRFVADDQHVKYEAWIRHMFGPAAARLGLASSPSDDIDAESSRSDVIRAVAWYGRDQALVDQCVALAQRWRDVPTATRGLVLSIAADVNPDVHAKLLREVKDETERHYRNEMFRALAGVRDPKRVEAALELLLDPQVDIRESMWMLVGTSTEATRKVAERFVRTHTAKLVARLPKASVTGIVGVLSTLFAASCDPAQRDDGYRYVKTQFGSLPGAERVIEQSFEAMDQCIASRKLLEPELRAVLSGVKLAKPAKP